MRQNLIIGFLLVCFLAACDRYNDAMHDIAPVSEVEVVYDEPITAADEENLDVTIPGAREESATSTTQYFQCKTDDGDLLTNTFEINDYYYGTTKPTIGAWDTSPTAKNGAIKVTRTIPKGAQLVKSKSLKYGWHIVTTNNNEQGNLFEVKPDQKGLIEMSWLGSTDFYPDHALIRVNFKYVDRPGDRYNSYTASQQNGKTFAQWIGTNTSIDNIDWNAVTSTYQLQPVAGTVAGTYKSIAYRAPRYKGYVFTGDAQNRPRGADIDLIGKKGVTLTYKKIK